MKGPFQDEKRERKNRREKRSEERSETREEGKTRVFRGLGLGRWDEAQGPIRLPHYRLGGQCYVVWLAWGALEFSAWY